MKFKFVLLTILSVVLFASCSWNVIKNPTENSSPKSDTEQDFRTRLSDLDHLKKGRLYKIDPSISNIRIYAYRAGQAAKLGHNHVLSSPKFEGYFWASGGDNSDSQFELKFNLADFEIDNPEYRNKLGPAFQTSLSKFAIDGTRDHMLGEDNFQADKFPHVFIRSLKIAGESPKFVATIEVEIHGTKCHLLVPITALIQDKEFLASGNFAIKQSDFGVKPYSVLGGVLAVQDEVSIEFELKGSLLNVSK